MTKENPKNPDGKITRIDTYKAFSHERPEPTNNPPIIQPIQSQPPKTPKKPNPQPNNSDSE
jgi:hypothetical protein